MAGSVLLQIAMLVSPKNKQTPFAEFEIVKTVGTCWESNLGPQGKQCSRILVLSSIIESHSSLQIYRCDVSSWDWLEIWRHVEIDYLIMFFHWINWIIQLILVGWCRNYVLYMHKYFLKCFALLLLNKSLEANVTLKKYLGKEKF